MAEKKRVAGVVDRVEGDVAVVVFKDPDSGDNREVYVDKKKLKRIDLKEGDPVTVEMSQMVMPEKSQSVSLLFSGMKSKDMAKRFYSYLVDGGLEDLLIQRLSGKGITLEISGCDNKTLTVNFQCSKETPAKKAVAKKAPKKTVKKAPKKPAKKTPTRRSKKA
jgi:translation initiation factor IF-1